MRGIIFVIFVVSIAVWAVVGFLFWIPLLARATAVFSAAIIYATITRQRADRLQEYLRIASSFWVDGFRIAKDAIYTPNDTEEPSPIKLSFGRVIGESIWTLLFWMLVLWWWEPNKVEVLWNGVGEWLAACILLFDAWAIKLSIDIFIFIGFLIALVSFGVGLVVGILDNPLKKRILEEVENVSTPK